MEANLGLKNIMSRPCHLRRAIALAPLQALFESWREGGKLQIAVLNCSKKQLALLEITFSFVLIHIYLQKAHLKITRTAVYYSPAKSLMARPGVGYVIYTYMHKIQKTWEQLELFEFQTLNTTHIHNTTNLT